MFLVVYLDTTETNRINDNYESYEETIFEQDKIMHSLLDGKKMTKHYCEIVR